MFVFGDYEGLRRSKGIPYVVSAPSPAARGIDRMEPDGGSVVPFLESDGYFLHA